MKILTSLLTICLLSSCTNVQPWEREILAKTEMQFTGDTLSSALHAQIHESKEASSGSSEAAGTGCGCN